MVSNKTDHHPLGAQLKAYDYSTLQTRYNERFTHFLCRFIGHGSHMDSLSLAERIDKYFPQPKSNRGYKPSEFIKTLILMQHEGSFHLDEVRHIQDDEALRTVLDLKKLPRATTLGDWLRRMGNQPHIQDAWVKVNKALLQSALHRCKK